MITVEVDGVQYDQLLDIEIGMSLTAIARDFNISVAQPAGTALPFTGGESIKVFIDGDLKLDGFIFTVTPSYSKTEHTINMTGRSKVADLVDSSLLPINISADISLQKVIERVISQLGLDLTVINQVSGLKNFNLAEDKLSAEPGDNAFKFIETLARKRQVLLTSDPSGNIIITRNGSEQNPTTLFNPADGKGGNIIRASVAYNMNNRFNRYVVQSQSNGAAEWWSGKTNTAAFVNQKGEQIDPSVRKGRQKVIQAEKASSSSQAKERAIWMANIDRVKSRDYKVTVQGVRPKGGEIWDINRLQEVVDEQTGINELMLIDGVRFSQSKGRGTVTQLKLVDKDAYTVSLSEPQPAAKKANPYASFR